MNHACALTFFLAQCLVWMRKSPTPKCSIHCLSASSIGGTPFITQLYQKQIVFETRLENVQSKRHPIIINPYWWQIQISDHSLHAWIKNNEVRKSDFKKKWYSPLIVAIGPRTMMTDCQRGDSKQCNMTSVILPKSESPAALHAKTQNTPPLWLPIMFKRKLLFYCVKNMASLCNSICNPVKAFAFLTCYRPSSHSPWCVMLSSWSAFCLWLFPPWISIPNMVILLGVSHFPPQPIPFLLCVSSSCSLHCRRE